MSGAHRFEDITNRLEFILASHGQPRRCQSVTTDDESVWIIQLDGQLTDEMHGVIAAQLPLATGLPMRRLDMVTNEQTTLRLVTR